MALKREFAISVTLAKAVISSYADMLDTLLFMKREPSELDLARVIFEAGLVGDKRDSTFPSR